jgi:hypothetical protein
MMTPCFARSTRTDAIVVLVTLSTEIDATRRPYSPAAGVGKGKVATITPAFFARRLRPNGGQMKKKVTMKTVEDFRRTLRMTRDERQAWEEMRNTLVDELTMILWEIRCGHVPPASLVEAVNALIESARWGWGEFEDVVDVNVLDPWYVLHPHPACSA